MGGTVTDVRCNASGRRIGARFVSRVRPSERTYHTTCPLCWQDVPVIRVDEPARYGTKASYFIAEHTETLTLYPQ